MSKFFSLCKANSKKHGLKDQSIKFKAKPKKSGNICFAISIFLIILIFSVLGFYIFNITSTATAGFKISAYRQRIADLKLANENLKNKIDNFENLSYLKDKSNELGLVPVEEVEYLKAPSEGVALK